MKRILFILLGISFTSGLYAQNEVDALRYSQMFLGGTARYTSMGGAFGALGGDFSTLSLNPAGIGVYKASEFTFTPSIYNGKTESMYNETFRDDYKYNFNFGNIGVVYTYYSKNKFSDDEGGWKNAQFGFGINRQNNFNNRIFIEGSNAENSLLDQYVGLANGTYYNNLDPFSTQLAFNTWLLDTLNGPDDFYSPISNGGVLQRKVITTKGSMNEMVISLGGNYNDRLYIGATLGLPFLHYKQSSDYTEFDDADTIADIESYTVHDEFTTNGSGINFKFGLIFRAANWFRLGAAVHSPTYYYTMDESYKSRIDSYWDDGDHYYDGSEGNFDYTLTTPMRAIGSVAFVIGKAGIISADYEYINYSDARLRADWEDVFADQNLAIRENYKEANNIRVGTEWRFQPFSFRAGYAMYGNPFSTEINTEERTSVSFGFGFRQKQYFIDLAYLMTTYSDDYYIYDPYFVSPAKNDYTQNAVMLTMGFRY